MNQSFFNAAVGANAQQGRIDVLANNIANTNTNGYKAKRGNFVDLLYQNAYPEGDAPQTVKMGSGTRLDNTSTSFDQGSIMETENPNDYAIEGSGFFALQNPVTGEVTYTRNGNFRLSQFEDGQFYLTSADGDYVLDSNKNKINVTFLDRNADENEETEETDEEETAVLADGPYDPKSSYDIGIFDFSTKQGMLALEGEKFSPLEKNGEAFLQTEITLRRGAIELSNVDVSNEFSKLIESQRAYQYALKMIKTSDEVEEIYNSLR